MACLLLTRKLYGQPVVRSFTQYISNVSVKTRLSLPTRKPQQLVTRTFQTTSKVHAAPLGPLLVKLSSPLYRFGFLYLGRRLRQYWNNLPPDKRAKYTKIFSNSRNAIFGGVFAFGGLSGLYYISHLEEAPVTHRKRFMILNHSQLEKVAAFEWQKMDEMLERKKLPPHHPLFKKVYKIVKRILIANQSREVNGIKWEVNVVDSDEVNAFVLANGQIFVFTGILNEMENENELAGVLGHEIAHAIMGHSAELLSLAGFFNVFSLAILTTLWAVIPTDIGAFAASLLQNTIEDLIINLPYSRKIEQEADEVGLLLAARACYDVRYVPRFWHRMHLKDGGGSDAIMKWFSTHPTNASRVKQIDELMPEALELRSSFQCPQLQEFYDASHRFRQVRLI